jgi:membrane protease YdiL (CAAX protease family)
MNPQLLLALPGLAVVAWYVVQRRAESDPLGEWPSGALPDTTVALVAAMAAWLFAQGFLPGVLAGTGLTRESGAALDPFAYAAVNAIIGVALLRATSRGTRKPKLSAGRILVAGALAALVVFSATVVLVLAIERICELMDFKVVMQSIVDDAQQARGSEVVKLAVAATLLAPVAEEIFFRGILLPAFARVMDGRAAIFLQAMCFGAIHVDSWNTWPLAIPLAVVGWATGWIYVRTGSLAAPIVLHAVFNAINFALLRTA